MTSGHSESARGEPTDVPMDQPGQGSGDDTGRGPQPTAASGQPGPAGQQPQDADQAGSGAGPDEPGPEAAGEGGNDLAADLAEAQRAVTTLTGDLQRLQAEYVNYKRRVDRDRELVQQNATFKVLSALLPVLDALDRAREHGELEGGFKAIADSLENIVAGQGLVKFGKPGDEFDPRLHEAVMHSHSPDVTTTTCQHIVHAGYKIGDRVVRPATVTVVDPEPAEQAGAGQAGAGQAGAGQAGGEQAGAPSADHEGGTVQPEPPTDGGAGRADQ